ncbi:MAG: phosphatase PAP2 family protein [Gallionella sp.]
MKLSAHTRWRYALPLLALSGIALLLITGKNIALFIFLNTQFAVLGDTFWSHLTVLGDTTLALLLVMPLLVRKPQWSMQFLLAALFATLYAHGMKELFSGLRPPAVLSEEQFHLIGFALRNNSFPSGHTTTIFLVAGWLAMAVLSGWARLAVLVLAILVGLSRIACGVHWPLDVLGGMAGGWLCAVAGIALAHHWQALSANRYLPKILLLCGIALAIWSGGWYDNSYAGTRTMQIVMSLLSAALLLWQIPRVLLRNSREKSL